MNSITFDTLKFVEHLEAGGFTHQQAKATAEAFAEATSQELATKTDIATLKADITLIRTDFRAELVEVKADIALIRTDFRAELAEVKSDIALIRTDFRAELAETKADIMKWMIGALGIQTLALLGGLAAIIKIAGH